MTDEPTLGDALTKKRGRRTQEETAAELDVRQSTLGRWEKDEATPGVDYFDVIEKFLGISDAQLGVLIVRGARRKAARQALR